MSNTEMKANRFGRWANARSLVRRIQDHLISGGVVCVATALRATYYTTPQHAAQFEARKSGAYAKQGRSMVCIDFCAIKFGRKVVA